MRQSWRFRPFLTAAKSGHLVGDVPALLLVAGVLWFLSPTKKVAMRAAG